MERDAERIARVREALERANVDVLASARPANVLLLTGYWPVIGISLVLVSREGQVILLVPEDEKELAANSWADEIVVFKPSSLSRLIDLMDAIGKPLEKVAKRLGTRSRIGYESGNAFEPYSYVAVHVFGASVRRLLTEAFPNARLYPAENLLARLRSNKTPNEVKRIRQACTAANAAFLHGVGKICFGQREFETAAHFRNVLSDVKFDRDARSDGFVFCMSGPNSAEAYRAYSRSRDRQLSIGDFALVHCNSFVDGFWTDITRTYCLGEPNPRQCKMLSAIHAASAAALESIRPGVCARDVDRAARDVLSQRGFGDEFKHSTGHGVGFAAIDHHARPRLHPKSNDCLKIGMVFNVEPAIYVAGYGGARHCDMVTVSDRGAELLTPFQTNIDELVIS